MTKDLNNALVSQIYHTGRHMRATEEGLFLKEYNLDFVSEEYAKFLTDQGQPTEADRAFGLIFSETDGNLYYLDEPEPGILWSGYLIRGDFWGIPASLGKVKRCSHHLSPRDPMFNGHNNIKLANPNDQNIATILLDEGDYVVPRNVFEDFIELALKVDPEEFLYQRDCLKWLYRFFADAEVVNNFKTEEERELHEGPDVWTFFTQDKVLDSVTHRTEKKRRRRPVRV